MLDGFKILNLSVKIADLLNNNLLLFPLHINDKDGEIMKIARYTAYKGVSFIIKDNNVKFYGSFHKYFNAGMHNYNDYNFNQLVTTIKDIEKKFKIDINNSMLNNLEFGVNIETKETPTEILKSIISYKGKPFNQFNIDGAKGIECTTDNFYIKIYNKSHQYKLTYNLLRYEIKVIRMIFFESRGININSLLSLVEYAEISKLKGVLLSIFNDILFYDNNIDKSKIKLKEQLILSNGSNPKYWSELKPNSNDFVNGNNDNEYKSKRKKYYRELNKFKDTLKKYSECKLQENLTILIENKCNELLELETKKGDNITDIKKQKRGQYHRLKNDIEKTKKGTISHFKYSGILSQVNRKCLTCNKDISDKKINSKFCSKKCKNDYTNPKLNPRNNLMSRLRKYNNKNLLFDTAEFIKLTAQQKELINRPNSIYN